MWKKEKKPQNTRTPSTQTVSHCPRLHPSHLFICHFHADETSLSVCPIGCIFFPLQTISDSFSQLTQMASINFFIKIRIYKSEQFNKLPRDRQGATRISQSIVEYADSICSLFLSLLHQTAPTSHSGLHLVWEAENLYKKVQTGGVFL